MKRNGGFQISTGVTSILMIFVILCLTTFGILSYTSAKADYSFAVKNADYISSYYDAYSRVNEKIAAIDEIVNQMENNTDNMSQYLSDIEKNVSSLDDEVTEINCERTNEANNSIIRIYVSSAIDEKHSLKTCVDVYDISSGKRYDVGKIYVYIKGGEYIDENLPDMWGE